MTARTRVEKELERLRADARNYRLLGAGESARKRDSEERLARSSVEEIHQSVHYALELLRRSLDLHTAAALAHRTRARTSGSASSTASDETHDALSRSAMASARWSLKKERCSSRTCGLPQCSLLFGACPIRATAAIPVMEDGIVRGVLCLDRLSDKPLHPARARHRGPGRPLLPPRDPEQRVFAARARRSSRAALPCGAGLGAALSEKDVLEAGVRAAREIASFDLAAVTVWNDVKKYHEVCAATSNGGGHRRPRRPEVQAGTGPRRWWSRTSSPCRTRAHDPAHQTVLTKRVPWPNVRSSCCRCSIRAASRHPHPRRAPPPRLRRHGPADARGPRVPPAVSLSNARGHKLETMATTDGMTGLLNKRAMLEAAAQKIAAAQRFNRKLSVLVTDIDFQEGQRHVRSRRRRRGHQGSRQDPEAREAQHGRRRASAARSS